MIIVVTGLAGSGKTTAAKFLAKELNANLIDADKLGHKVLEKSQVKAALKKTFWDIIRNNKISRRLLAQIVFSSKTDLKKLNKIVHPLLIKEINSQIKYKKINIIDAALYHELNLGRIADCTILIKSFKSIREKRAIFALRSKYQIEPKDSKIINNNSTKQRLYLKLKHEISNIRRNI